MGKAFRFVIWLLLFLAPAGLAYASYDDSRSWFQHLSEPERSSTQTDLLLLGYYQFLVDGEFGRGTFDAIAAFQKAQGKPETGILTAFEQRALRQKASEVNSKLGIELVSDTDAQVAMMIPVGLLTVRNPTGSGTSYVSDDGEFSLETMHSSLADQSFEDLFNTLTAPDPDRVVTYRSFGAGRFVVSGRAGDYSFYTMFVSAANEAIGYSLAWGKSYEHEGAIASVYIASHFTPLANLPATPEVRKAEGGGGAPPPGAFTLPADQPDVILLNADITESTSSEFDRALDARPKARIVALNSPGGSVDSALQMAYEIRKRGLATYVPKDMGCYSACAYMFFAGVDRRAEGELGVHQISSEVADLVLTQTTLGDLLDALQSFGVHQQVISHMLRTPPDDMYVFTEAELADYGITSGDPIDIVVAGDSPPAAAISGETAFVQLASQSSATDAERSRDYAEGRWASLFGEVKPEVLREGNIYRVRLPTPSVERANAICAAIKADGGGCYVTSGS